MKQVNSVDSTEISFWLTPAVLFLLGVALCFAAYKLLNTIPEKWLRDYDEIPNEEEHTVRYKKDILFVLLCVFIGVLYAGTGAVFGFSFYTVLLCLFCFVLLLIALSDGKYTIIPDQFVVALALIAIAFAVYDYLNLQIFITQWWSPIVGALCGGGFFFLLNIISLLVFKKEGIGFGDVKLFAACGIALGFPQVFVALTLGIFIAFITIVFQFIQAKAHKKEREHYMPLGPFLCMGTYGCILFYFPIYQLIQWYIGLLMH